MWNERKITGGNNVLQIYEQLKSQCAMCSHNKTFSLWTNALNSAFSDPMDWFCFLFLFLSPSLPFTFWQSACLAFRMKAYSRLSLNNNIPEIFHQQTIWWMMAILPTTITKSQNHYIIVHCSSCNITVCW